MLTALLPLRRPSASSPSMTVTPTSTTSTRYSSRNTAPPLLPILYGKPQILPRPTAEPIEAMRKPKLLPQPPRLDLISVSTRSLLIFSHFSQNTVPKGADMPSLYQTNGQLQAAVTHLTNICAKTRPPFQRRPRGTDRKSTLRGRRTEQRGSSRGQGPPRIGSYAQSPEGSGLCAAARSGRPRGTDRKSTLRGGGSAHRSRMPISTMPTTISSSMR